MNAAEYLTPLLQGNARQIAERLGWPSGTVQILHRLWPPAATFSAIETLKWRLNTNDAAARRAKRVLPHCSYITSDSVRLIGDSGVWDRGKSNFLVESCSRRGLRTKAETRSQNALPLTEALDHGSRGDVNEASIIM